jgi:peptidyl-prolyl cis-trans isomerase SurA
MVSPQKPLIDRKNDMEAQERDDAMKRLVHRLFSTAFAALLTLAPLAAFGSIEAAASEIKFVVNNTAITTYDIQKRAAFLRLQHKGGALEKQAADAMVEQALKAQELEKRKIVISKSQIDAAFAKFAASNKMTTKQLSEILDRAGVTASHFKEFMRVQMGWGQLVGARYRAESGSASTEQEAVQRMLQKGGAKPSATEYLLQQVIFVVPAGEKGKLPQRRREAEAMRQRFSTCETTRQFAKGLIDVTVRDLPRVLAPQLPADWADLIKASQPGTATKLRETDRGVEFIGICSTREVSDDRVAQLLMQDESGDDNKKGDDISKKYVDELRAKARIVQR